MNTVTITAANALSKSIANPATFSDFALASTTGGLVAAGLAVAFFAAGFADAPPRLPGLAPDIGAAADLGLVVCVGKGASGAADGIGPLAALPAAPPAIGARPRIGGTVAMLGAAAGRFGGRGTPTGRALAASGERVTLKDGFAAPGRTGPAFSGSCTTSGLTVLCGS